MRVAAENIYEPIDETAGLSRLAIPAGSEVTDEDVKRLGLKKNDPRLEEVKPEKD
jgi:hypothetical protein